MFVKYSQEMLKVTVRAALVSTLSLVTFVGTFSSVANAELKSSGKASGVLTKACVLYAERKEHPFWGTFSDIFSGHPEISLVEQATPADMLDCLQNNNPTELLIFAHAFMVDGASARLGFFMEQSEQAAHQSKAEAIRELEKYRDVLASEGGSRSCSFGPKAYQVCGAKQTQYRSVNRMLYLVQSAEPGDEIYDLMFKYRKGVFLQRSFEQLFNYIKEQQKMNPSFRLKKIRMMSCEAEKIFQAYPSLKAIVKELGIELDQAPESVILSSLKGASVTNLNQEWLKLSLDLGKK